MKEVPEIDEDILRGEPGMLMSEWQINSSRELVRWTRAVRQWLKEERWKQS